MDISTLKKTAAEEIKTAPSAQDLEFVRIKYLGRQEGEVTKLLRSLKDLTIEEKRTMGPQIQQLKAEIEELLENRLQELKKAAFRSSVDLSAPGKRFERGHLHPITLAGREIRKIFMSMNFSVLDGPEVETEYYNFDALNVPADHPARDMWDTFWLKDKSPKGDRLLLRTHTSPMQVRFMEKYTPPFQIIVPGRTFRFEAVDAGHETNFHQLEGLMVGKDITLANFKFVVEEFFKRFFAGQDIEFRYRPSYFPFVEPGVEVDIKLGGKWLEMGGAGMVHPRVFEYAHYNPREWRGFAFGFGIDRLARIKYGIPDVRLFFSGDLRFIKQF
jgi:phenylalanyl-tRNA synthetase alpha chain